MDPNPVTATCTLLATLVNQPYVGRHRLPPLPRTEGAGRLDRLIETLGLRTGPW